jgi:prepilin-type processing-associated H-X9-DG protein
MPALRKVKEAGKKVVCTSLIKQMGMGNQIYASDNNGQFVYSSGKDRGNGNKLVSFGTVIDGSAVHQGKTRYSYWSTEEEYLSCVGMTEDQLSNLNNSNSAVGGTGVQWPDSYLCPSFKELDDTQGNTLSMNVSYGYSIGYFWSTAISIANASGVDAVKMFPRELAIRNPSGRLMFTDSQNWYIAGENGDYRNNWDDLNTGHETFWKSGVMYRHSEGANVAFFDGHSEYLPKEKMYYYQPNSDDGDYNRNTALWEYHKN